MCVMVKTGGMQVGPAAITQWIFHTLLVIALPVHFVAPLLLTISLRRAIDRYCPCQRCNCGQLLACGIMAAIEVVSFKLSVDLHNFTSRYVCNYASRPEYFNVLS